MVKQYAALVLATCAFASCPSDDNHEATDDRNSDGGRPGSAVSPAADDDAGDPFDCEVPLDRSLESARAFCARCAANEPQLCCVVSGNCCTDALLALPRLDFERCADGAATCDVPGDPFGEPTYRTRSFVPAASETRSGFVLRGSVDERERIRLQARMQASPCFGCAELVGVGLSRDPIANITAPELSIVVSSQLLQVTVANGTKSLWSMAIDSQPHDFVLDRMPDGSARFYIDGQEHAAFRVALLEGGQRPFVFGRTDAAASEADHARIHNAEVASGRCERTPFWQGHERVLEPSATRIDETRGLSPFWQGRERVVEPERRGPSVIRIGNTRWLAYATDTGIEAASARGDEPFGEATFSLEPGEQAFDQRAVSDPEWVLEEGGLALYYTAVGGDWRGGIGRVRFETTTPGTVVERAPLLVATELGVPDILAPSVTRDAAGNFLLVVLALDHEGKRSLRLLRGNGVGPGGAPRFDTENTIELLRSGTRDYTEVASADIALRRGQYQLYFSGMSDSRWVTGLLVSNDLQHWLSAGTVLALGPRRTFDGNGAYDPETFVDGDVFALYYTGFGMIGGESLGHSRLGRVARTGGAICGGVECSAGADCAPAAASCSR